jgi:alkyl hydroperoxide reductase subunit AhpC
MIELGELEKQAQEFKKRNVQLVVISNDNQQTAQATKKDFPDLVVVADADMNMAKAMQVIQPGVGPHGSDTNAPTTILVDGTGTVRWLYRPERFIIRLSPEQLLAAIDENKL